jgi:hypothetical protein
MAFRGSWIAVAAMTTLILCIICGLFVLTFVIARHRPVSSNACLDAGGVQIVLQRPFRHLDGLMYVVLVRTDIWRVPNFFKWEFLRNLSLGPSDTNEESERSNAILCEDGKQLGPPHSQNGDIARLGRGRFIHYGPALLFSSSDGSDPNENGRTYKAIEP